MLASGRPNRRAAAGLLAAAVIPAILVGCPRRTAQGPPPVPSFADMNAKVRVDMTETEVTRALGTAYSGRGSPGEAMDYVYSGSDADLGVMARNGRVTAVVRMPHWQPDPRQNYAQQSNAMRSKARVGMSLGQVWAAIGRPSQVLSSATDDSRRQVLSYGFCRVHLENDRVVAVD